MTRQVQVAVIGGGIMGVAALYHLADQGWTDAVLFEKAELTSGSTWHAAGQIAHAVGSRLAGWINKTSIDTYLKVEAETGQSVGWHPCGGYRIANTSAEVDWLKSIMGVGRLLDFPMELVGPDDIAVGNPFYNTAGVRAAVRTYEDGHIDPSGATQALAAAARARGAKIERRNRVVGAARRGDQWRLVTEQGDVLADHVVIAAGSYANQVGEWFGLRIPSASCLHHYLVTDPVPEFEGRPELPVMRDNSFGGYIRQEQRSGLIGIYESRDAPIVWANGAPWDAENPLFDADYEAIGRYLERAFDRMPILENLGVRRVVRGAITHTPDGGMLVGPSGAPNVWLACGASIGLAWAGGACKVLADLMVQGQSDISARSMDPRRFGDFATDEYILEKTKEDFEIRHDTPVPGMQRPRGRPWVRHPLWSRLSARGGVMGEVAGWERPRWFAEDADTRDSNGWRRQDWHEFVADECRAVRESAGVIDLSAFAQFEFSGADAGAFLDRLSANRLPKQGRISLAHMLTPAGRFETEVTIWNMGDGRWFTGSAIARHKADLEWMQSHILAGEDVTITDRTYDWGMLAVSGPMSREILATATDADLSSQAFGWLTGREISIFGADVYALRVSFAGELGWELHMPLSEIGGVYDALSAVGRAYGLRDIGSHALNSLRMEKGYRASAELTPDVGMAEAGLERFFVTADRSFVGDAPLPASPAWRLIYASVDADDADCFGGEPVLSGDQVVGMTTSGGYGHTVSQSLCFAYIRADAAVRGLSVLLLNDKRRLTVLDASVWDAANERLRS